MNHDLNPYAFLITFIHEVAHLNAFIVYKFRHEPHGKEWKNEYKLLLKDFLGKNIFPEEIETALKDYSLNPAASSCSDPQLMRALRLFDDKEAEVYHLEDIPENTVFRLHQSRSEMTFQKGFRMRTRFHCIELKTKRVYYVNCMAEVKRVG